MSWKQEEVEENLINQYDKSKINQLVSVSELRRNSEVTVREDETPTNQKWTSDSRDQTQSQGLKILGVRLYTQKILSFGIRCSTIQVQIYLASDSTSSGQKSRKLSPSGIWLDLEISMKIQIKLWYNILISIKIKLWFNIKLWQQQGSEMKACVQVKLWWV